LVLDIHHIIEETVGMGGAIRVKRGEYFFKSSVLLHGEDITLFGEGRKNTIHLQRSYILTNKELRNISRYV